MPRRDKIRKVNPVTANFRAMMNYAIETKKAARQNKIKGEGVYMKMMGGHGTRHDTWQVFFLEEK